MSKARAGALPRAPGPHRAGAMGPAPAGAEPAKVPPAPAGGMPAEGPRALDPASVRHPCLPRRSRASGFIPSTAAANTSPPASATPSCARPSAPTAWCAPSGCLAYAGCRLSEARALTVDRIDLAAGVLVFATLKKRQAGVFRAVPVPPALLWSPHSPRASPSPQAPLGLAVWILSHWRWGSSDDAWHRLQGWE